MVRVARRLGIGIGMVLSLSMAAGPAWADPLPGFAFDPVLLEQRMDACVEYRVPEAEVLMGWVSLRDGAQRQWRCSSLRHMLLDADDRPDGQRHDPYVNVADFMRCVDTVIIGGFPRAGDRPEYTKLIKQYNGTDSQAIVVINHLTGDVVTVYTAPRDNEWSACANAL